MGAGTKNHKKRQKREVFVYVIQCFIVQKYSIFLVLIAIDVLIGIDLPLSFGKGYLGILKCQPLFGFSVHVLLKPSMKLRSVVLPFGYYALL